MTNKSRNRYQAILEHIFFKYYNEGIDRVDFSRSDVITSATELNIVLPKNLGDVIYSVRYRNELPDSICKTACKGYEWIIEGTGRAKYCYKLVKLNAIVPREDLLSIKIPDATPEIIEAYALGDEQALLAKVRYNRLIDIFLGTAAFSLQNHLRTTVSSIGQIEIDEIYVSIDKAGRQYIIPVQAKGGNDKHTVVQTKQDILCCTEKFPSLICRPVSVQFMGENKIAMFELTLDVNEIKVVEEKHYQLVESSKITDSDLDFYRR